MTDLFVNLGALFATFLLLFILLCYLMPGLIAGGYGGFKNHRCAKHWPQILIINLLCAPLMYYLPWGAFWAWFVLIGWTGLEIQQANGVGFFKGD